VATVADCAICAFKSNSPCDANTPCPAGQLCLSGADCDGGSCAGVCVVP
jgi:hypothetical protein